MCGICGITHQDNRPVDRELVQAMNATIIHRGPDGDGFYFAPGIGLAMRRLAVIDLNTGDQPITNEDESVWIVFNGEIFNFPSLRADLEARGHHFRTQTDTECIVHLYEDFGDDCIQYLRGQFAFALWDSKKQRLLIARDRLGQKPLYYTLSGDTLYFSSELSSLLEALPSRPNIHLPAIDLYLSLQYIPEPYTPYEGIFKLPAAHKLTFEQGQLNVERYWQLEYEPKLLVSEEELIEELRLRMRDAVVMRMISDVPLGAHLSGGIDSSIVVALMAQASSLPVKTFSVGFEEASFSELPYARAVAERYDTDHQEFTLTFGDIPATIAKLITHFGEPLADPSALPLYHLARLTRQHVTVALNGDGGDEAFAGYHRYWLDPWANRYAKLPVILTEKLVPALTRMLPNRKDSPVGSNLVDGLKRLEQLASIDPRASILRWGSYFSPAWKADLWREEFRTQFGDRPAEIFLVNKFEEAFADSFMDRTLFTDIHSYLPGDLLVKADRMTMAHSLEGRSPFLDHELASWAARLPENMKVRGRTGKYLLRKAFARDLPSRVHTRGKQGFGIPLGDWFRGPLADWAHDIILDSQSPLDQWFESQPRQQLLDEHAAGRANHGKRIYALVVLGLWAESAFR
ncbi:MAG: asparagine synthase (glutamine-hydrolyzing) [Anaerolineales bacterium]|nr:asparagine synthase (glutamine-hydrolyzing) [Chloroflexota bacterium]MBL6980220.1 asparagine synthase (glutamine-hydrolyzing) [Anaerolineales bacterium]